MQLRSVFLLLLGLFAFTCSAAPTAYASAKVASAIQVNHTEPPAVFHYTNLIKRTTFPVKADEDLRVKIIAAVKAKVKADILTSITASFSEQIKASLNIHVKILGGLIKVGNAQISAIQSAAVNGLKIRIEGKVDADVEANVYADIDAKLKRKLTGKQTFLERELLKLLMDVEGQVVSKLKVELPKIQADLKGFIKTAVHAHLHDVEVNIPFILTIRVDADLDVTIAAEACVKAALSALAHVDIKAAAKALLTDLDDAPVTKSSKDPKKPKELPSKGKTLPPKSSHKEPTKTKTHKATTATTAKHHKATKEAKSD
ncbi:hypothetical protein DFQ28_004311 [Apophysomyces sp. BC1034]|nr:hypothetical protein DFQ30_004368 [Apophysomyces sp. BC1015]KAG0178410.1 hypothetical protein DFQ29_003481 [Apophysomyces sp. BC1021]KAG0188818.1 hypothetical protein DFQ28_004311 [Apophysomyces sp. BC1034]